MTRLYHSEVFMPPQLAKPCYRGRLSYTNHAKRAAMDDRYGPIPLVFDFVPEEATLIESEVEQGPCGRYIYVVKQVWRLPLDDTRDLVMAITHDGRVKTVWVNLRSDKHKTLDRKKYCEQH